MSTPGSSDSPADRKQKSATTLLRDEIQKRNFAAFGPVSGHLTPLILPQMCQAHALLAPG